MKGRPTAFRKWLNSKGLTLQDFVDRVPGTNYNSVIKWASGASHPKKITGMAKQLIQSKFKDCPLVK